MTHKEIHGRTVRGVEPSVISHVGNGENHSGLGAWPDGTPRSTGNAFDLGARTSSVFVDPKRRTTPSPEKKFGKGMNSQVGAVKGLSQKALDQLKDAPYAITISTRADSDKRRAAKKANI